MVKNKGSDKVFNIVVTVVMVLFCLVLLIPLLHVLACSFSDPQMVYTGKGQALAGGAFYKEL